MASVLVFAIALMACSSPDADPPPLGLVGDWEMIGGQIDGRRFPMVDGFRITASFESDGTFGGTAACNGYGGSYVADSEDLIVGQEVGATAMACDALVMESETAFMTFLRQPLTYERLGDRLTISGQDEQLDFHALGAVPSAEVIGYTWTLVSWGVGDEAIDAPGAPATLLLTENGLISGSTGCRVLEGEYVLDADTVRFPTFGALGECSEELSAQDGHVVTVLGDGFTIEIDGAMMRAVSAGNEFLIYGR